MVQLHYHDTITSGLKWLNVGTPADYLQYYFTFLFGSVGGAVVKIKLSVLKGNY